MSAACSSWNCRSLSGWDRSTPKISAPIVGVSLRTSMLWSFMHSFLDLLAPPITRDVGDDGDLGDLFLPPIQPGNPKSIRRPTHIFESCALHMLEHPLRRGKLVHRGGQILIRSAHAGDER